MQLTRRKAFAAGAALRGVLLAVGLYQDTLTGLRYTDVDYDVFSDAARAITESGNPFSRMTYRYTPFLAVLLVPNVWFSIWGKVLFALGDLVVAWIALRILQLQVPSNIRVPPKTALAFVFFGWLVNPMVAQVSTRGSSDSLTGCLVLALLFFLLRNRIVYAGLIFGFAVHWRVFPVIYAPAIYIHLCQGAIFPKREHWIFGIAALCSFTAFTGCAYAVWGHDYLDEAILYHARRLDHRHNFSAVYYPVYLAIASGKQPVSKAVMSVSQMILLATTGFRTGARNLAGAFFLQSLIFVSFNSVVTAQYFMWYQWFLPIILPQLQVPLRTALILLLVWVAANALWLAVAYQLELQGSSVHRLVWLAGLIFLLANTVCILTFIRLILALS